ncbi:DUF3376 domain-containing protein [Streptomyces sp. NPDC047980]|uniref:DUF3376 domain-containing protein n=1 Tax=Streptomyces sp. NPDC047980 TaxID=3365494 RepID=UPI00371E3D3D
MSVASRYVGLEIGATSMTLSIYMRGIRRRRPSRQPEGNEAAVRPDSDELAIQPEGDEAAKREVRLALVMNGGVSLAVWMGGVAHELDLLRRASSGVSLDQVRERDREVFKIWKDLANTTAKRVQVDIISGTSAGGLNGLLLATAIGRRKPLQDLKDLWSDYASLKRLGSSTPRNSVLNGRQLEKGVAEALTKIDKLPKDRLPEETIGEPVTLFVTATALDGRCKLYKDGFGTRFDVRDHRRVYRFRSQQEEKYSKREGKWNWCPPPKESSSDFDPDNKDALDALKTAARATASFPVAFSPVSEERLRKYRVRPEKGYGAPSSNVMDGGVLNNAPFNPVLEEITRRPVDRPTERVLVYIVPTGGRLAEEEVKELRSSDIGPLAAGWSAMNYPMEADLRSGIEELHNRLQTSGRETREELFDRLLLADSDELKERIRTAASSLFGEYRRRRARAGVERVLIKPTHPETVTHLVTPPEDDKGWVEDVLRLDLSWFPPDEVHELDEPNLDEWRWGCRTAERLLQTLSHRLHDLLLNAPHDQGPAHDWRRKVLMDGTKYVSQRLSRMLALTEAVEEKLTDAVEEKLDQRTLPTARMGERRAAETLRDVFNDLEVPQQVGQLIDEAAVRFLRTVKEVEVETRWTRRKDVVSAYLMVEVLTQAFTPTVQVVGKLTPRIKFLRLGPDYMGPLFNEDWSADMGDKKLYGIRLRHFGAFANGEWRHSDFMWGRLDAAHHLLRLLLRDDPDSKQETRLHTAILEAEEAKPKDVKKNLKKLLMSKDTKLLEDDADSEELQIVRDGVLRLLKDHPWIKKYPWRKLLARFAWNRLWNLYITGHKRGHCPHHNPLPSQETGPDDIDH